MSYRTMRAASTHLATSRSSFRRACRESCPLDLVTFEVIKNALSSAATKWR